MNELPGGWICGFVVAIALGAGQLAWAGVTDLCARGYAVMPTPQQTDLAQGDVAINADWAVRLANTPADSIAERTLLSRLADEHSLKLVAGDQATRTIVLAIQGGTVDSGLDAERTAQAYQIEIAPNTVTITGNTDQGLFYGVQTLLQLLRRDVHGRWVVPVGVIRDWPSYQLRIVHWDTKHHQDRMETLKRYLDWSARFKINAIAFELEDKFEYPSHPIIGAPGAFTVAQMQELVAYGLERHIQIIPNIQAPAHMAYVLKHEQFAHLRSDGSNYLARMCDDEAIKLIFDMYSDVIEATPGVEYFFVSTDEVYYAGIDPECQKQRPYNEVNRSLAWVEYVNKAHAFLAERGRRVLVWAEYPLLTEHVKLLPPDLIDGIMGGDDAFIAAENELGIRQLAYSSMQGAEKLFPNHFAYDENGKRRTGRLEDAYQRTLRGKASKGNPIGTFAAAWDDAGLHNETFWLGWAIMAEYGWTPVSPTVEQAAATFMRLYYGPDVIDMVQVYRDLQQGTQFWSNLWQQVRSKERGPGYGNSFGKGSGTGRSDLTLTMPLVPELPDLSYSRKFRPRQRGKLDQLAEHYARSDRLLARLQENMPRATRNRYNVEVLLALAYFERHAMDTLAGLDAAEDALFKAEAAHKRKKHGDAVGLMVQALTTVTQLQADLDQRFGALKTTFEKSRWPKGQAIDGREPVHILDDVKDHFADRRVDLTFMIAPYERMAMPAWCKAIDAVVREYAQQHDLAVTGLPEARLED